MWVLRNEITNRFFQGWGEDGITINTTPFKTYALHYNTWGDAARDALLLTNNWKPVLKEEA